MIPTGSETRNECDNCYAMMSGGVSFLSWSTAMVQQSFATPCQHADCLLADPDPEDAISDMCDGFLGRRSHLG